MYMYVIDNKLYSILITSVILQHDVQRNVLLNFAQGDRVLLLLIISVTHSTCGVLCTVVGGVCAAASTILAVAIAKFRS